jgi:hypothetical protein
MKQAGYTAIEPQIYPPYLSIALDDSEVMVTVRDTSHRGVCGNTVSMRLPLAEFRRMLQGVDGLIG